MGNKKIKKVLTLATVGTFMFSVVAYAGLGDNNGGLRGGHYWASQFNNTTCSPGNVYMKGTSLIAANWYNDPAPTQAVQITAGVELWKDGYFVDSHGQTKNGSGKIDVTDSLMNCFHPASANYDFYASQNVWFSDESYNNANGAYHRLGYSNY